MKFTCPSISRTCFVAFAIVFYSGAYIPLNGWAQAQPQPPTINWASIHAAEAAANVSADQADAKSIEEENRINVRRRVRNTLSATTQRGAEDPGRRAGPAARLTRHIVDAVSF